MLAQTFKRSQRGSLSMIISSRCYSSSEDLLKNILGNMTNTSKDTNDYLDVLKNGGGSTSRNKKPTNNLNLNRGNKLTNALNTQRKPRSEASGSNSFGKSNNNNNARKTGGFQQKRPQYQQDQRRDERQRTRAIPSIDKLHPDSYDSVKFKWTTSENDLENEYMTSIIKDIYEVNPTLKISNHDETKGLLRQSLKSFIKTLKEDELFSFINVQEFNGGKYPFLKIVEKKACLKAYSDKLAEEKTKLYGRTREKKRNPGVKYVKVSWEISDHDLQNQKRNEIEGLLKSGQRIVLLMDTKDALSNRNLVFEIKEVKEGENEQEFTGKKLGELESIKRAKVLDYIENLFQNVAEFEVEGKVNKRVLINVKPIVIKQQVQEQANTAEKKNKHDDKKLSRQLKQKQREEEKRLKLEEKKKLYEELLAKNNITQESL